MTDRRQTRRYIKKFPVELYAGNMSFSGTTVKLSEKGFFVRSQKSFREGIPVDINIHLTDDSYCFLKGIVKYARSSNLLKQKNGMGIELTALDPKYLEFIRSIDTENR
jgi:Tfp pilus assembly protein PilZ